MPLPTVAGTLVTDINPATWGLAGGTALTFANSGLTPVVASPTLMTNVFGSLPAIHAVVGVQGFSIARPVQDDFTLYGVFEGLTGAGTNANWYNNASLVDAEHAGVGNDFGITLRGDGKLTGGTGNPDTTVTGTKVINDPWRHIITIKRTKSTGQFRVYVDGTLDITLTNNTNSLTYNPNLYFFIGESAGRAGGLLGRWLAYDAPHSDSDRALVEGYLDTTYPDLIAEIATKVAGYAVLGVLPDMLSSDKTLAYAVLGAGQGLSSTKTIAYAVIQQITILPSQVY